jgi:hypothetical protein
MGRRASGARRLRRWPLVALGIVALMLCSAGTAGAAFLITGKQIKDGTLTSRDIRDHSLTAKDIKGGVIKGPAGATGQTGDTGVGGGVGPAGPAAISAPVVVSNSFAVRGTKSADASVACPSSMVAIGGGASTLPDTGEIEQSAPSDAAGDGWTVSVFDEGVEDISGSVVAVCVTAH